MTVSLSSPLFGLGVVTTSPAALEQLASIESTAGELLQLHRQGEWPDLDVRERSANYAVLASGTGAIVGRFRAGAGIDDFVVAITYPDRLTLLVTLPQAVKCLGTSDTTELPEPGFDNTRYRRAAGR